MTARATLLSSLSFQGNRGFESAMTLVTVFAARPNRCAEKMAGTPPLHLLVDEQK